MTRVDIMKGWSRQKGDSRFYRLTADAEASFEYRGKNFGHPSTFGAVRIEATPSLDLRLESVAPLPSSVSSEYADRLLSAIGHALIDDLFAAEWYPYRGCGILVREIGWDDITSSEASTYRAARGAFARLRETGIWEITP